MNIDFHLDEFLIKTVGEKIVITNKIDISVTNVALSMFFVNIIIIGICYASLNKVAIVPTRLQMLIEVIYTYINDTTKEHLDNHMRLFFPYILTIFLFIFISKICGSFPYIFNLNSHPVIPLALSCIVFILATVYGIYNKGRNWIRIFIPKCISSLLLPIVFVSLVISYFTRIFSIAFRLFVNTLAFFIIITCLSMIASYIGELKFVSVFFIAPIYLLNIIMAFVQAYIFTFLSCVIIRQASELY